MKSFGFLLLASLCSCPTTVSSFSAVSLRGVETQSQNAISSMQRRHASSKHAFLDKFGWGGEKAGISLEESHSMFAPSSPSSISRKVLGLAENGGAQEQQRKSLLSKTTATMISMAVIAAVLFYSPLPSYALETVTLSVADASNLFTQLSQTGFYQAFSLVFLSEIGDKTFFIAGLLAMKTSKIISYLGSMGALAAMTVLSCIIGQVFHAVPAGIAQGIPLDDVAAVAAFTFFGLKTLKEANEMDAEGGSVMEEELKDAEETVSSSQTIKEITAWGQIASTFALVFAAEFGDRSFLSTIALSAAQNPFSVCAGAVAAHGLATGIAVLGGSYVAKYISEKVIGYIGGSLFLLFAFTTALGVF